jgi:hypothetical protein
MDEQEEFTPGMSEQELFNERMMERKRAGIPWMPSRSAVEGLMARKERKSSRGRRPAPSDGAIPAGYFTEADLEMARALNLL